MRAHTMKTPKTPKTPDTKDTKSDMLTQKLNDLNKFLS